MLQGYNNRKKTENQGKVFHNSKHMDMFSKTKRSKIMSAIKSKNTSLEKRFQKLLSSQIYKKGFRYRLNYSSLIGKPDIVFPSKRLAIFIDGDFWHGYNFKVKRKRLPKKYWQAKIQNNINRDKFVDRQLKKNGRTVLRFWEHNIKKNPNRCINKIKKILN